MKQVNIKTIKTMKTIKIISNFDWKLLNSINVNKNNLQKTIDINQLADKVVRVDKVDKKSEEIIFLDQNHFHIQDHVLDRDHDPIQIHV